MSVQKKKNNNKNHLRKINSSLIKTIKKFQKIIFQSSLPYLIKQANVLQIHRSP